MRSSNRVARAAVLGSLVLVLATLTGCGGGDEASASSQVEQYGDASSFVAWSGTGGLRDVDPALRNGVYSSPPPMVIDTTRTYRAVLTTSDGRMVFELYADTAPNTVNNFVALARDGYYDGTIFHRVLAGFMAQGGDPSGRGTGGPGYTFADETAARPALEERGLLAMANAGPNTNGSQFFVTFVPTPWLDGLHTVFGHLVEGDDVLSAIDLRDPVVGGPAETLLSVEIIES